MVWKSIEVVITALTRNQVVLTGSWVRIPPLPPILVKIPLGVVASDEIANFTFDTNPGGFFLRIL